MTEDIARIGFRVDTRELDKGTDSLDRMSRAAKDAERSADRLGDAGKSAGDDVSKGARDAERAATSLANRMAVNAAMTRFFTTALTGFVAASATAWAKYDAQLTRMQQSLNGAGRAAGVTLEQMNRLSASAASASGLSIASSQNIMAAMAGTGRITGELAGRLTGSAKGFGRAFGLDYEQAGGELAKAFADPMKGAEQLNERFGFLNDALRNTIQRYMEQGDRQAAQNALMSAYQTSLAQTVDRTNIFVRALEAAKTGVSDFWTRLGKGVDYLLNGPTAQEALDAYLKNQGALAGKERDTRDTPNRRINNARNLRTQEELNAAGPGQFGELFRAAMAEAGKALGQQRDKELNDLALKLGDVIRQTLPDVGARHSLQDRASLLNRAASDPELRAKLGLSEADVRQAIDNVNNLSRGFKTATERMVEDSKLAVQGIMARSLGERMAVDAERARLQVMRETGDAVRANVAAEAERMRLLAEASREIRENSRQVANQSELVGLRPLQRALQENEQRYRDMQERLINNGERLPSTEGFKVNIESSTTALKAFADALNGATVKLGGKPADTEWRAQVKVGEESRAGNLFNPSSASPFTTGPFGSIPFDSEFARNLSKREMQGLGPAPAAPANAQAINEENRLRLERDRITSRGNITRQAEIDITQSAMTAIEAENAMIATQTSTLGMSNTKIAEAVEYQRLYNQAVAGGVEITPKLEQEMRKVAAAAGDLAANRDKLADYKSTMDDLRGAASGAVNAFGSTMMRTRDWAQSARAAADSLMQKLLQMATNHLIMGLLGKMGTGDGGLLGSLFGPSVGPGTSALFANGGIMTGSGPMPLRRYAGGGIANSPQLAMFGEGSTPEAYVPLPDGRSIPVSINAKKESIAAGRSGPGQAPLVQVFNQSNAKVETRTGAQPDGRQFIEFVLSEVGEAMASGRFDAPQQARFNMRPTKVFR